MSAAEPSDAERRVGRPRSALADQAILDAAIELFAEHGFDGLTVEGVAARAGVGKATIYRRYPCKVDLLIAAKEHAAETAAPLPDTGTLTGDLLGMARNLRRLLLHSSIGKAFAATLAAKARNEALAAAHREFIAERRASCKAVLRRAVERGELPAHADLDLAVDLVNAPIFYRVLVSGDPVDDAFVERLVQAVTVAIR